MRADRRAIVVNPVSGKGDVVAEAGVRLYEGLCETVGMLMAVPSQGRQIAVMPRTEGTHRLAHRLAPRCAAAGIEIAVIGRRGEIFDVPTDGVLR